MAKLQVVVVTPERTVLDRSAEFVTLPLYDGEIGILPNRAPLIGRLQFGEMRVRQGSTTDRYYIDGGFVQVLNRAVTVLTSRALPTDQIDVAAAEQQLRAAEKRHPRSRQEVEQRNRQLGQARAMLRAAAAR